MSRTKYRFHPACTVFPQLPEVDLQDLAADIAANGLRNPIVLWEGKILDGRNRYLACEIAQVEPRFTEFEGDDPIGWVVSQNLVRRHLTASQKAVVALDLLPLLEKEAKQRQRRSNEYRGNGQLAQECDDRKGKAAEAAARIVGASPRYVEMVKSINTKAPELLDPIRRIDRVGGHSPCRKRSRQKRQAPKTHPAQQRRCLSCDLRRLPEADSHFGRQFCRSRVLLAALRRAEEGALPGCFREGLPSMDRRMDGTPLGKAGRQRFGFDHHSAPHQEGRLIRLCPSHTARSQR